MRDEDFLGSHILQVEAQPKSGSKNGNNSLRESRVKARSYTTFNGRTVVIKESIVYTNRGKLSRSIGDRCLIYQRVQKSLSGSDLD